MFELVVFRILLLKKGVKVILIKNIVDGLFNGMIGIVYYLERGSFLVVNFSVNLVIVFKIIFKVYDSR